MLQSILRKIGLRPPEQTQLATMAPAAAKEKEYSAVSIEPMAGETSLASPRTCGFIDAVKSGWFNMEDGELVGGFPISAEDIVLDVGCGDGGATLFCARQGAHVVFSDLDRQKVEQLTLKVAETPARKSEGLVCDTNPLPLADGYASRIMAMEMLEHTEQPDEILRELVRVGQPGALYLLTVPDSVAENLQKGIAPDQYFQAPNHVRIFGRDEFEQTVLRSGLEIVRSDSYSFYWAMWMLFYWAVQAAEGREVDGAVLDEVKPPYHPLLEAWSATWFQLLTLPQGLELKKKLDQFMPKSQLIVARKPL